MNISDALAKQTCVPCSGSLPPATPTEIAQLSQHIPQWAIIQSNEVSQLQRQYQFPNFAKALAFTNEIGKIAEAAGHHPSILTEWGNVRVTWWTHAIQGLHHNDFVMAAKTDALFDGVSVS